jgi:O-antigen biosynthesis protein WbqV
VRDNRHVDTVFRAHKPQLIFHAAAVKHVPIAEFNIEETVLTNVFGTCHIAEACQKHQAEMMVMISTDKAVNPTNVMGASKRLAESFCQALGNTAKSTKFITVRFGNVLGSTGSVVPLFREQLAAGGPITVTHPEMTRYFMTVREAVELVLQASVLGISMEDKQECIFVLDMGQPVRILDLAMQMIRLAGLKPDEDIKITYTGLRPGEKLYEELFHFSENAVKTAHESIFLASPRFADMASLRRSIHELFLAASDRKTADTLELLKQLVPEFKPTSH